MWRIPGSVCGLILLEWLCCLSPLRHRFLMTLLFNLKHSNVFHSKWKVEVTLVARSVWFHLGGCRGSGGGALNLFVFCSSEVTDLLDSNETCKNPTRPRLLTWTRPWQQPLSQECGHNIMTARKPSSSRQLRTGGKVGVFARGCELGCRTTGSNSVCVHPCVSSSTGEVAAEVMLPWRAVANRNKQS